MKEKILLEVVEAHRSYVDKNVVTIANSDMEGFDLSSGDIVKIGSEKELYLRVIRVDDIYSGKIGINGETRSVLGVSVGEKISVQKVDKVPVLKSVTLSILPHESFSTEQLKQYNAQLKSYGKFKELLMNSPLSIGQKITVPTNVGKLTYSVVGVMPKKNPVGIVDFNTNIDVSDDVGQGSGVNVYYEDIGGLEEEIEKIREMVEFPMKHPDLFQRLGISAPKGVLLTGPPGTGKTLLAKAVATETDAKFISIAGPEIMSKYHGGSEENLRSKFEEAEKNAPAIVFIDEIDAIAPKRGESHDQAEKRVVTQLLTLMDGLKSRGQVVVMAATNRPDDLDEALRRPGRFDREIKINPPSEKGRKEILQIHTRSMPLEDRDNLIKDIAKNTIGYTGADLEVLCKEAALRSVKPFYKSLVKFGEEASEEDIEKREEEKKKLISNIKVTKEHFVEAMRQVEPSAMREVLINKPNVEWKDVGGLDKAKEKLRELVELPLLRPDLYSMAGIKPSKGVLLTGPPGTGKTLLAKAVATESNANFISVKGPELISKWVGESEKHVREIFKKARQVAPTIIFFDEFDSISKLRGSSMSDSTERIVNQLLTELDGVEELEKVMIVAATNRKDLIDPALLRPGRIDSIVELEIPDKITREEIFKVHTKNMPLAKDVRLSDYIGKTEGWTGADIEAVARNAGIHAIKRIYLKKNNQNLEITKQDFNSALQEVAKSSEREIKEDKPVIKKEKCGEKISKKKNTSQKNSKKK